MDHGEPGHRDLERERFESAYEELKAALDDERQLSDEINSLLESSPSRVAAERTVLHEFVEKMARAQARSRGALTRWLSEVERL